MVTVENIKNKIKMMGESYKPGNVSKTGHLYSPIPFLEFNDIPFQRNSLDERLNLITTTLPRPFAKGRLLDLGCHVGYNCFSLSERGYTCTGVELDKLTFEIAQDLEELKRVGVEFINAAASANLVKSLGYFDVTLFLSTFQWVVYANGFEAAVDTLAAVQENCGVLFFETSMGQEGKMKLPQLPNAEAVQRLLQNSGAHQQVDCVGEISAPPGFRKPEMRMLFRSQTRRKSTSGLWAMGPRKISKLKSAAEPHTPLYRKENAHYEVKVHPISTAGSAKSALKIVRAKSDAARLLLYREHEFLASLDSESFPKLQAFGFKKDDYFLITSWIEGPLLSKLLATGPYHDDSTKVLEHLELIQILLEDAGIQHRDIRPDNIIISPNGPVLFDFGWSCWSDEVGIPMPAEIECSIDIEAFHLLKSMIAH